LRGAVVQSTPPLTLWAGLRPSLCQDVRPLCALHGVGKQGLASTSGARWSYTTGYSPAFGLGIYGESTLTDPAPAVSSGDYGCVGLPVVCGFWLLPASLRDAGPLPHLDGCFRGGSFPPTCKLFISEGVWVVLGVAYLVLFVLPAPRSAFELRVINF